MAVSIGERLGRILRRVLILLEVPRRRISSRVWLALLRRAEARGGRRRLVGTEDRLWEGGGSCGIGPIIPSKSIVVVVTNIEIESIPLVVHGFYFVCYLACSLASWMRELVV